MNYLCEWYEFGCTNDVGDGVNGEDVIVFTTVEVGVDVDDDDDRWNGGGRGKSTALANTLS